MENNYLQEAIRIGDQMISSADQDEHGLSWATVRVEANGKFYHKKSEGIYDGVSGIALLFLYLSQVTKEQKYLDTAIDAMRWVDWYCDKNPTSYYAFLSGRMGVAYLFLALYEVTNKKDYLTKALNIAKKSGPFLSDEHSLHEYINGIAGTLLVLTQLYEKAKKPWLLALIKQATTRLLDNGRYARTGLFWDRNDAQIRPLCGFSHGTSGIGFVFLELGHYFQNPAFYFIAKQAFAYENNYFDKEKNNWPDFRINLYTEAGIKKLERDYKKKKLEHFTTQHDMNSWCHGAAGIALSRIRAQELLGEYQEDIERAKEKTLQTGLLSFTLCHGDGGNAELFVETDLQQSQKIADATLLQKKEQGKYTNGLPFQDKEDFSLLNGIAGIGYFLLRVYDPKSVPSILAPRLTATSKITKQFFTFTQINKTLLANSFPLTIKSAEQFAQEKIKNYFTKETTSPQDDFVEFIKKLLPSLPEKQKEQLEDVFELEQKKHQLSQEIQSNALIFIKERITEKQSEALLKLSDTELTHHKLVLLEENTVFITKLQRYMLLRQTPTSVLEVEINQFCADVLQAFNKPADIKGTIVALQKQYNMQKENDKKEFGEKVMQQIREALTYGILAPSETNY